MNELKVFNTEIIPVYLTDQGEQVLYGRQLQDRLHLTGDYTTWMTDMIAYGFIENIDYQEFWEKRSVLKTEDAPPEIIYDKGIFKSPQQASALGYSKNHLLKADMAKHIAMIQRTPEGILSAKKQVNFL